MAALTQIREALDRMAKGRELSLANFGSGDDFWTLVDAAADETYENRVKGSAMTDLDTALGNGSVWGSAALAAWFTYHDSYFQTDLSISASPPLSGYLAAYGGWRVPYYAAECLVDAKGTASRLPTYRVFPKGTRPANEADPSTSGMQKLGRYAATTTWTADTPAIDTTRMIGAPIVAINLGSSQTAGCTLTCTCQDGTTTKDLAVAYSGATQYTQTVLGSQAITSTAAAGQKVVAMAATGQFRVGDYVLIYESDALQEIGLIASIQTNTSLTMTTNLLNEFSTSGFVYPMFQTATLKAASGTGSGNIDFFYFPDRAIAL